MKEIGNQFLEYTKYEHQKEKSDEKLGVKSPLLELPYDETKDIINLPSPSTLEVNNVDFLDLVDNRRSVRRYSKDKISLEELSYLLWCTQGVKKVIETKSGSTVTLRTVPSAGSRHPFETLLLINNVEGLTPGLYRYVATKHILVDMNTDENISELITRASFNQRFVSNSAVTFIWIADIYRTEWRYQNRSYRYVFLDAGHVSQNLYLAAETINCGACAIAAYNDNDINELLNLDGESQFVIYMTTVGKKRV